jgi:hypothetical protein
MYHELYLRAVQNLSLTKFGILVYTSHTSVVLALLIRGSWRTPASLLQESSDVLSKQESRRRAKRKAWRESRQGHTSVQAGESPCRAVCVVGSARLSLGSEQTKRPVLVDDDDHVIVWLDVCTEEVGWIRWVDEWTDWLYGLMAGGMDLMHCRINLRVDGYTDRWLDSGRGYLYVFSALRI